MRSHHQAHIGWYIIPGSFVNLCPVSDLLDVHYLIQIFSRSVSANPDAMAKDL